MYTVQDVFDAIRELPTVSEQGTAFEKLMVNYFQLHPVLRTEYDYVARFSDWNIAKPGSNQSLKDLGIDLVARRREDQTWTAIQCKFYSPSRRLSKEDINSFFTESGRQFYNEDGELESFTNRIIIATTDNWSDNARDTLKKQTVPVQTFGLPDIADAPLDWDIVYPNSESRQQLEFQLHPRKHFEPRPHQRTAIDKALVGFATHDRGKLVMACGTGKTFTSLKLAEEYTEKHSATPGRSRILFCVPSISLLSQTLREWSANSKLDLMPIAVCSDKKVSKQTEDIQSYELEIPVSTDPATIAEKLSQRKRAEGMKVVFSTYQSLEAIHQAQKLGAEPFDLIICDEAHRTTGVTMPGDDHSAFVAIHDANYIRGGKRLYMTATPRLYDDKTKDRAADRSAEVASMDDEAIFGPEFHRLGFGEAVDKGLLTDYKVLVLTVDESVAAEALQRSVATVDNELNLDTASRLIGAWNAMAKRSGSFQDKKDGFESADAPMERVVAFARDIASSKQVAEQFPALINAHTELMAERSAMSPHIDLHNADLKVAVEHVDGTMNAQNRGEKLTWLKAPVPDMETRVLSNARCLSEGVDVPALDAVLFLNPRNSVVDVVQSVGRVMRKSDGKDYGYIILPVGVPAGVSPSAALADNKRFHVVWQVLNALRAHDDRFNAMVNSAQLNALAKDRDPSLSEPPPPRAAWPFADPVFRLVAARRQNSTGYDSKN